MTTWKNTSFGSICWASFTLPVQNFMDKSIIYLWCKNSVNQSDSKYKSIISKLITFDGPIFLWYIYCLKRIVQKMRTITYQLLIFAIFPSAFHVYVFFVERPSSSCCVFDLYNLSIYLRNTHLSFEKLFSNHVCKMWFFIKNWNQLLIK